MERKLILKEGQVADSCRSIGPPVLQSCFFFTRLSASSSGTIDYFEVKACCQRLFAL